MHECDEQYDYASVVMRMWMGMRGGMWMGGRMWRGQGWHWWGGEGLGEPCTHPCLACRATCIYPPPRALGALHLFSFKGETGTRVAQLSRHSRQRHPMVHCSDCQHIPVPDTCDPPPPSLRLVATHSHLIRQGRAYPWSCRGCMAGPATSAMAPNHIKTNQNGMHSKAQMPQ